MHISVQSVDVVGEGKGQRSGQSVREAIYEKIGFGSEITCHICRTGNSGEVAEVFETSMALVMALCAAGVEGLTE